MSFADIRPTTDSNFKSDIRRTEFMQLQTGANIIRILEPTARKFKTHYLNKATVVCLEDDCPICANNKKLIMQFPDTFRDQHSYNRASERFYVNVFDKTPAKVCTACGKEYKKLDAIVCSCGQQLPTEVKPLNKVKVLAKGPMLFGHLETINNSILDQSGNQVGINNYDVTVIVSGAGRDVNYTPIPNQNANAPVELGEQELFDLDKAVIVLTAEELLDLQRGITLKDIFAARRSKEEQTTVAPQVSDEVVAEVNSEIAKLFQQN